MNIERSNQTAESVIKEFEGTRLDVYLDSARLPTVGTGHLIVPADGLVMGDTITQERADRLLEHDMAHAVQSVDAMVTADINENQRAALISFAFNVGVGALRGSHLLSFLNGGDPEAAADQFLRWTRAGGVVVKGLVRRREAERGLFMKPVEVTE